MAAIPETRPKTASKPKRAQKSQPAGRNLVIMLDGTGNELGRNLSNILKLYRIARKDESQLCYYSPGVGTVSLPNPWARFRQKANGVLGLATGYGLDANVLGAYRFLVENWREGDRIYLFGFSRGAWTARVLAGLIHMLGLLYPEQLNMCDSALGTYKRAAQDNDLPSVWHFARVIRSRRVTIEFVGVWDSVASVLVPRKDRLYIPSLETLPYTRNNPSVAIFRHALAIDERRRMFRVAVWDEGQAFEPNPFNKRLNRKQDVKQMWFAGVHSDVGGGYPETESALSKYPLIWMVEEAAAAGLKIQSRMLRHLAYGEDIGAENKHKYVAPSPAGRSHKSLTFWWKLLEIIPKRTKRREWKRPSFLGLYIPWGEPRFIAPDALIHPSVRERQAKCPDYRPPNLRDKS